MGNKLIIVQLLGKLQDKHLPQNQENETRMSHSTGGQGCDQEGLQGCPEGVCVCVSENRVV